MYEMGVAVEQDHNAAYDYFRKARDLGNSDAMFHLAEMFDKVANLLAWVLIL